MKEHGWLSAKVLNAVGKVTEEKPKEWIAVDASSMTNIGKRKPVSVCLAAKPFHGCVSQLDISDLW